MLSNQCFAVRNLVSKSQVRCLSRVKCLSKGQQQTFNKICCLRVNPEAIRCISMTVQYKPIELIRKGDSLLKKIYIGSYLSSDKRIHVSPTSYQRSNQDDEKRKNYIFIGGIVLMVICYIILSLSIEKHHDYVVVK